MSFLKGQKGLSEEEFSGLFERYFEQIKRFVYYKTGEEEIASDIAQDVFLKVWERRKNIKQDTAEALLYTMANRLFISRWRKQKVAIKFMERAVPITAEVLSPELSYVYEETKKNYEKILSAMPEECRTVFLMSRIDELKYKEIATCLAISVKTVEKRMSKALSLLRDAFAHYEEEKI